METEEEGVIIEYFKGLKTKEEQERILSALSKELKSAPYYLKFKMDKASLTKMGKVAAYCQRNKIHYIPKKRGDFILFEFKSKDVRNETLVAGMIQYIK
jgi:hypothetical protein